MRFRVGKKQTYILLVALTAGVLLFSGQLANADAIDNYERFATTGNNIKKYSVRGDRDQLYLAIEYTNNDGYREYTYKTGSSIYTSDYQPRIMTFEHAPDETIVLDLCKANIGFIRHHSTEFDKKPIFYNMQSQSGIEESNVGDFFNIVRNFVVKNPNALWRRHADHFRGTGDLCNGGNVAHIDLTPYPNRYILATVDFNYEDNPENRQKLLSSNNRVKIDNLLSNKLYVCLYSNNDNRITTFHDRVTRLCKKISGMTQEDLIEDNDNTQIQVAFSSPDIRAHDFRIVVLGLNKNDFNRPFDFGNGKGSQKDYSRVRDGDLDLPFMEIFDDIQGPQGANFEQTVDTYQAEVADRGLENEVNTAAPGSSPADAKGCESEQGALGWILCPVINFMLGALESFRESILQDLLIVRDELEPGGPAETIWKSFVGIANVLFVAVFIVIVFGQTLSIGVDTYTIKRMLPRLVIAVIGVQLSFFGVKFLLDIFNILGIGVLGLITTPLQGFSSVSVSLTEGIDGNLAGQILFGAIGGTVGTLAGIGSGLWIILTSLPVILLTLLAIILTLVLRQIVIVALAVIAPLAIVAWVLPNTEKYAKSWMDLLIKSLAMFPIIMLLIGIGALIGTIASNPSGGGQPNAFESFASIIANFAPYFLIPFTFKFAGSAISAIGGGIQQFSSRASVGKDGKGGLNARWNRNLNEGRMRTAAGATALGRTRLGRVLARPMSGLTRRSSAAASQAFTSSVVSAGEDIQKTGMTDLRTLKTLSRYKSYSDLKKDADDLRSIGKADEADALLASGQTLGSRLGKAEYRTAAFQRLASYGKAEAIDFERTSDYLGANPGVHSSIVSSAAVSSKDAGAYHLAGYKVDSSGVNAGDVSKVIAQMGPGEWSRAKPEAIAEIAPRVADMITSNNIPAGTDRTRIIEALANASSRSAYLSPEAKTKVDAAADSLQGWVIDSKGRKNAKTGTDAGEFLKTKISLANYDRSNDEP